MPVGSILVSLLLSGLPAEAARTSYVFVKEWETDLGPMERRIYRLTVCPDGTSYLTDAAERLAAVGPDGRIAYDTAVPALRDVTALACDSTRLFVGGRGIIALRRDQLPEITGATSVLSAIVVSDMTVGDEGTLLVAGSREGDGARLHRISLDTKAVRPYATEDVQPGASSARIATGDSVLWDPVARNIIHVPSWPPDQFRIYENDGRLKAVHQGEHGTPGETPGSTIIRRAARLADGRIIALVRTRSRAQNIVHESGYYEVLGSDLVPVGRVEGGFGIIQGTDANGGVYFSNITPAGTRIVRARLVRKAGH